MKLLSQNMFLAIMLALITNKSILSSHMNGDVQLALVEKIKKIQIENFYVQNFKFVQKWEKLTQIFDIKKNELHFKIKNNWYFDIFTCYGKVLTKKQKKPMYVLSLMNNRQIILWKQNKETQLKKIKSLFFDAKEHPGLFFLATQIVISKFKSPSIIFFDKGKALIANELRILKKFVSVANNNLGYKDE